MSLEDLVAKRTGPSSISETVRQLAVLAERVNAARDAAVAAVAGLPTPGTSSNTSQHGGGGEGTSAGRGGIEHKEQLQGDRPGLEGSGEPLPVIEEGQEGPQSLGAWLWSLARELAWHFVRAAGMACLMLAVMWIMELTPGEFSGCLCLYASCLM